jgi:hypothetical protein
MLNGAISFVVSSFDLAGRWPESFVSPVMKQRVGQWPTDAPGEQDEHEAGSRNREVPFLRWVRRHHKAISFHRSTAASVTMKSSSGSRSGVVRAYGVAAPWSAQMDMGSPVNANRE